MVNCFELFGLPVSFHPDREIVKRKFYELSRQFHPDRFAQAGGDAMDEALRMSAAINEAYRTLSDGDATMKYVLKFYGVLEDEEKYNLPSEFLMEMMELNEAVSDFETEPSEQNKQSALGSWQRQKKEIESALEELTHKFDHGDHNHELLLHIKDYYFRKKYLLRIQERLNAMRA